MARGTIEFECMDEMISLNKCHASGTMDLFNFMKARYNGLQCPPYEERDSHPPSVQ